MGCHGDAMWSDDHDYHVALFGAVIAERCVVFTVGCGGRVRRG